MPEDDYKNFDHRLQKIEELLAQSRNPSKAIYTSEELCALLSVSKRTCQDWRDRKLIGYSKIGGKIYYTWDQITSFLEKYQVKNNI